MKTSYLSAFIFCSQGLSYLIIFFMNTHFMKGVGEMKMILIALISFVSGVKIVLQRLRAFNGKHSN